ncbi:hypothetical protein AB0M91_32425, partial [Micromonospora rifamycinica]|uniref:hypothetical protein n=1 Tax=Micromonospora rifamycinica TaxID=291594 RepID=UPI0034425A91
MNLDPDLVTDEWLVMVAVGHQSEVVQGAGAGGVEPPVRAVRRRGENLDRPDPGNQNLPTTDRHLRLDPQTPQRPHHTTAT